MVNKKTTLLVLFLLALGLLISCNSTKLINENIGDNQITISLTECGSYEVKNNQVTIGYAVKRFIVEVDRVKEITEFERKLRVKYKNKFNKDYRVYTFTTDRAGDTILMTLFLSSKQVENNPNWKCQLQEVGTYPKRSVWVDYNCSKNRFKVPGDPD
ncbi:hypothetical protein SAMN02927921_03291 [Sinomicrobium oceani]|uniref:Lipoprotein n=1 Tax=Sinomicrobium oceani TaxID=1150368 RepID=A0A1K1R9K5_9FLAO|nr:hypothetical protein [Sinomicrobium oceani]SFW68318.1 hypothetical protein SAMN02927921_03291 [Sinomicrobium oceani]